MEKTKWFKAGTKPSIKGVYEVSEKLSGPSLKDTRPWFAYFDGDKFGYRCLLDPQDAEDCKKLSTCLPELTKWRGLAQDPNTK